MQLVESDYQAGIRAISPAEAVVRSTALFQRTHEALARQVTAELGDMPAERRSCTGPVLEPGSLSAYHGM